MEVAWHDELIFGIREEVKDMMDPKGMDRRTFCSIAVIFKLSKALTSVACHV